MSVFHSRRVRPCVNAMVDGLIKTGTVIHLSRFELADTAHLPRKSSYGRCAIVGRLTNDMFRITCVHHANDECFSADG